MKLLFLCKQRPQQRDLLLRPYGRFFYLPVELASLGHEVEVLLLDFKKQTEQIAYRNGVAWRTIDVITHGPSGFFRRLMSIADCLKPDWVIGLSDTWPSCIAYHMARRLGCDLAIDAYDNYESYMPWNTPLHWLWRKALASADLVTVAGPQLAHLLGQYTPARAGPWVLPMAADPPFKPIDRSTARRALALPEETPLVGYFGGWERRRGTDAILQIIDRVSRRIPGVRLVLSGTPPAFALEDPRVIPMGYVDDSLVPALVNAVDVVCVLTRHNAFGDFSYPAKLCEAMACRRPVVATATQPVRWMLGGDEQSLTPVDNSDAFAEKIVLQLCDGSQGYPAIGDWSSVAREFSRALSESRIRS